MYDEKFFSDRQIMADDYEWFGILLKLLFKPRTIIDFGCGNGLLMAPLARRKLNVIGIEYSDTSKSYADELIKDNIYINDLTKPIENLPSADVSVCIEVAEHIEEIYADVLINNITHHSKVLIFSAAPPFQGGVGHINLKDWSYWEQKLLARGYKSDVLMTQILKSLLSIRIKVCKWIPNNIHVLREITY